MHKGFDTDTGGERVGSCSHDQRCYMVLSYAFL
jgi:hypothetical protein